MRPAVLALAGALALGGCATKGDVQMAQGEVSLLKACESAYLRKR